VTHNNTLDRLRAALKLTDAQVAKCFSLAGHALTPEALSGLSANAQGDARTPVTDALLVGMLDGLILLRRGPSPSGGGKSQPVTEITHNVILKKLRIALNLHEADMLKLFAAGGKALTKGELTVLFRKPTHKHFKVCDDELFATFLNGIKKTKVLPKR